MAIETIKIKGPNALRFFKNRKIYPAFHFHELMHEYGDVVKCSSFFYLINDPETGKAILNRDQKDFHQQDFISKRTRVVFGEGLVTNEGSSWASQRKILNPIFKSKAIHENLEDAIIEIDKVIFHWKEYINSQEPINIADEMENIAILSSGKILFDMDMSNYIKDIKNIVKKSTKYMADGMPFFVPYWIPTLTHIKLRQIRQNIDAILEPIIDKHIKQNSSKNDLVNILLNGLGNPNLTAKNRRLVIDEMMTMMAGGYFPISSALSLFWFTMGKHPKYLTKMENEIRSLPKDYEFSERFYNDFPITSSVIFESMRLYPAAFSIWRKSKIECEINGYVIPKGKSICISLFNIHRNPKFWDNPDDFIPERFNYSESKERPKHYFMPFGWGGRKCIGDHYAVMIIFLTVIKIIKNYNVSVIKSNKLEVKPLAIICPKKVEAKIEIYN